jgi:hypothetical protein
MKISCAVCSRLKNEERSFYKYAAPQYDNPLPGASQLLKTVPGVRGEIDEKDQIRVCPDCNQLYHYKVSYEYHVNGSEDEELLTRLTEAETGEFCKQRVRELEQLRREIDGLGSASGDRSDYIDHGNPNEEEERQAYADMEQYTAMANTGKVLLNDHVEFLRNYYPKILANWAEKHIRVCEKVRASYDEEDIDGRVSVFVANETIDAWRKFLEGGESFVTVNEYWLGGYSAFMDELLLIN